MLIVMDTPVITNTPIIASGDNYRHPGKSSWYGGKYVHNLCMGFEAVVSFLFHPSPQNTRQGDILRTFLTCGTVQTVSYIYAKKNVSTKSTQAKENPRFFSARKNYLRSCGIKAT